MTSTPLTAACPRCQHGSVADGQTFCTQCGVVLRQPCPQCSAKVTTPSTGFTACAACRTALWSCSECARLYHYDRTSCSNSYCPQRGAFWTAQLGSDVWDPSRGHRALSWTRPSDELPRPAWLVAGSGERRYPSLHHSGLLVSVQESGVLELWAERGAPRPHQEGEEFREDGVCLVRLDMGEPAGGPPLLHRGHLVMVGSTSLSTLELTSNPSLSGRLELPGEGGPRHAVSLGDTVLVVSSEALWEVDLGTSQVVAHLQQPFSLDLPPLSDGQGRALVTRAGSNPGYALYEPGGRLSELASGDFPVPAESAIFAGSFLLLWRQRMATWENGLFTAVELPAAPLARPVYCSDSQRLTLLLSDGTIRTCTTRGERFTFVGDRPGTPTTAPLKLGEHVFYGTDGRYLCCDEEALLPRLNSPPWGELSFANGRLFGTTREGGLFAFCL